MKSSSLYVLQCEDFFELLKINTLWEPFNG